MTESNGLHEESNGTDVNGMQTSFVPNQENTGDAPTNGIYVSDSTIDNPPKEEADDSDSDDESEKQETLPGFEQEQQRLQEEPHERMFKAELTLTLTPAGQKSVKIPVVFGEFNSNRVWQILTQGLTCRRVSRIVDAVLDNPEKKEVLKEVNPLTVNGLDSHPAIAADSEKPVEQETERVGTMEKADVF